MKPIITVIALFLLISCNRTNNPKIVHDKNSEDKNIELVKDSSFIEIADLPIEIDSTSYLIHPIGYFKVEDSRGKIVYKSSGYSSRNFSISNYGGYTLSGNLTNVMFQHKNSSKIIPLTKSFIKIISLSFLKKVSDNIKRQYLVYKIIDKDSNKDGKLDYNDINSLYMSKIDGTGFVKLSSIDRELINWKIIESKNRLYFRTVEDLNKDGVFDKMDAVHYKFIDLNTDELKAIEYNPF